MARAGEKLREDRIQPDELQLLLLVIRPARPTLAEVPLADLAFHPGFTATTSISYRSCGGRQLTIVVRAGYGFAKTSA